ncbi:hypothetical protein COCNU_01G016060 [Cocos nucifera]|uniref:Uncharacterized protein n=1 Tax=Cocos nucifera TaxID=13894 RepID=A0A8K0MV95_COCNU|nr:hypothetical protein COCNU_01G016060 [Cocos nucifera]
MELVGTKSSIWIIHRSRIKITLEERNHLTVGIKSLKRKGSSVRETSKKAHTNELISAMPVQALKRKGSSARETSKKACTNKPISARPIQAALILEANMAAPLLTLPPVDTTAAPLEQCKVVEKGKKKKDAIRKRVRWMVENSNGEGSDQERVSLDDRDVIQSLMKGSILLHIIDKMIKKEDAERFDESFAIFLEVINTFKLNQMQNVLSKL